MTCLRRDGRGERTLRACSIGVLLSGSIGVLLSGCGIALGLPAVGSEEGSSACQNGIDDDLDGRVDCADASCAAACFTGAGLLPPVARCFDDPTLDLAYRRLEEGLPHARCEPDPEPRPTCTTSTRLLPGATDCRAPGAPCLDAWPGLVGAQHVDPRALDGDGTADRPWTTLAQALAAASPDAEIWLSEGEHDAPDTIDLDVTVRGLCPERTVVRGRVHVNGRVTLQRLGLRPAVASADVLLSVRGQVSLEGVVVEGSLEVEGETAGLSLDDAWVRGSPEHAWAIDARGARLFLTSTTVDAPRGGLRVESGALAMRAVAVRGTTTAGLALLSDARARCSSDADCVRALVVEPQSGIGIDLRCTSDSGRCADLEDVLVRFPVGATERSDGIVAQGGDVRIRRVFVSRARGAGVRVDGSVAVEDAWIENSTAGGISVGPSGVLVALRSFLQNNEPQGLLLETSAVVAATNLEILGSPRNSVYTRCVEAETESALGLSTFAFRNCGRCGIELWPAVQVSFDRGLVESSTRGVCLFGGADYPASALASGVTYRDIQAPNPFSRQ